MRASAITVRMRMARAVPFAVVGVVAALVTLVVLLPARWVLPALLARAHAPIAVSDISGSVWSGSAALAWPLRDGDPIPWSGRVAWRAEAPGASGLPFELSDPSVLTAPVRLVVGWNSVDVGGGAADVPEGGLAILPPPLGQLGLVGKLHASWQAWSINPLGASGSVTLDCVDLSSRMSLVAPLGSYRVTLTGRNDETAQSGATTPQSGTLELNLVTIRGPLLIEARGVSSRGRLEFSGLASAEPAERDRLSDFLSIVGEKVGDRYAFHWSSQP